MIFASSNVSREGSRGHILRVPCCYTARMDSLSLRVDDSLELRQVDEADAEELTWLIDRNRSHLDR